MTDSAGRRFAGQLIAALGRQTPAFVGREQSRPAVVRALGRSSPAYSGPVEEADWLPPVAEPPVVEPPVVEPPVVEPPSPPGSAGRGRTYYRDVDLLVTTSVVVAGGRAFAVNGITDVRLVRSAPQWLGLVIVLLPLSIAVLLPLAGWGGTTLLFALLTVLLVILAAPLLVAVLAGRVADRVTGGEPLEVWIEYRGASVRLTRARDAAQARNLVRSIRHVMRLRGQNAPV